MEIGTADTPDTTDTADLSDVPGEDADATRCEGVDCQNTGVCQAGVCNCDGTGFTGDRCEEDIDECLEPDLCGDFADCINSDGAFTCECQEGFERADDRCVPARGPLRVETVDIAVPGACIRASVAPNSMEVDIGGEFTVDAEGGVVFIDPDCTNNPEGPLRMDPESRRLEVSVLVTQEAQSTTIRANGRGFDEGTATIRIATDYVWRDDRTNRVLVVYNVNDPDAQDIAEFYAGARSIPLDRLCPVSLPRGHFATPDELIVARDQIAERCLCPLVDEEDADCTAGSVHDYIAAQPITHLTLIRGMPARITGTRWPTRGEDPAFDYYLSHTLTTDEDIFAPGTTGRINTGYDYEIYDDRIGPGLDPAAHGYFAVGRVQAITIGRTFDLIDRTLEAERTGFSGNIASEALVDPRAKLNPGRFFTSTVDPSCLAYLTRDPFEFRSPESSWPFDRCRWGTTGTRLEGPYDGMMPGFTNTTIPSPTNVSWFVGSAPRGDNPINNFQAFHDYNTMLQWRTRPGDCVTECSQFDDPDERQSCRVNSRDYFHEINTECVGVHPHFIGQQFRSWPVQYYGFYPEGWRPFYGGESERIAPRNLETGGFQDDRFTDGAFLRFGGASPEEFNEDVCVAIDGTERACPERSVVNIERMYQRREPVALPDEDARLIIRFRYRNQGAPGARMQIGLKLGGQESWAETAMGEVPFLSLEEDHLEWTLAEYEVLVPPEVDRNPRFVRLQFDGRLHRQLRGFFDLDTVELSLVGSEDNLVGDEFASFDYGPPRTTHHGGSATDVIDRMGGIGYWGSSSHHITGGGAYGPRQVASRVFAGSTLGEALADKDAKSGIAYVDPLLRPYGVRLHNALYEELVDKYPRGSGTNTDPEARRFFFSAFDGTDSTQSVRWSLTFCPGIDLADCDDWNPLIGGQGAVKDHPIDPGLLAALPDEPTYVRLRAWRPDRPEDHISAYAWLDYQDGEYIYPEECRFDLDGNGIVNSIDERLLPPAFACSEDALRFDLNDDGRVDSADREIFEDAFGPDSPYDFDEDGRVDRRDRSLLLAAACGAELPEEYDVNDDGEINEEDVALIHEQLGFDQCPCVNELVQCRSGL
jgi:hypothetical protein